MLPLGLSISTPAPKAAAIGSSINLTTLAPADRADSLIARFSTCVAFDGTQTRTLGLGDNIELLETFLIKCCNIFSVTLKSAITPSLRGLIASI